MIQTIFDSILGIIFTSMGLLFLLTPYDQITKIFPKAPSKSIAKTLSVIVIICGIGMIALTVIGIF